MADGAEGDSVMKALERFCFGSETAERPASHCGLHIDFSGARPLARIFEIADNDGANVQNNILQAAAAVRDKHMPKMLLQDIDWTLTHLAWHSDVNFSERSGAVTKIHLPDGMLMQAPIRQSMEEYQTSLNSGYYEDTSDPVRFCKQGSILCHPVYIPDHPAQCVFAKRVYMSEDLVGPHETVLADSAKLAALWRAQTIPLEKQLRALKTDWESVCNETWASGYDAILHNMPAGKSAEHIWGTTMKTPIELPYVHYYPDRPAPFVFTNGRHRVWNAIQMGAPYVALEMRSDDNTETFKKLVGWEPRQAPIKPAAIPLSYPQYSR